MFYDWCYMITAKRQKKDYAEEINKSRISLQQVNIFIRL